MQKGWIHLHRKIQDCWLWDEKPYDRARAWIDLLLLANHGDKKMMVGGKPMTISRGQYLTSLLKLSDRWGWSRNKTKRFMAALETDQMVTTMRTNSYTIVNIVNYGVYNDYDKPDEPTDEPSDGHQKDNERTTKGQRTNHKQECKEYKECEECKEYIELDSYESNRPTSQSDGVHPEIVDAWNSLSESGIQPIRKISEGTNNRCKLVRARIREYGVEGFMQCIENIRNSDFLLHKMNHGTGIQFDWMIRPSNFPKVLEGNYNNDKTTDDDEWSALL